MNVISGFALLESLFVLGFLSLELFDGRSVLLQLTLLLLQSCSHFLVFGQLGLGLLVFGDEGGELGFVGLRVFLDLLRLTSQVLILSDKFLVLHSELRDLVLLVLKEPLRGLWVLKLFKLRVALLELCLLGFESVHYLGVLLRQRIELILIATCNHG